MLSETENKPKTSIPINLDGPKTFFNNDKTLKADRDPDPDPDKSEKRADYRPAPDAGAPNNILLVRTPSSFISPKKNFSNQEKSSITAPIDEKKILPPTQKRLRHSILKRIQDVNRGKFEALIKDPKLVQTLIEKKLPIDFTPDLTDLAKVLAPGKNHDRIRKAFELCIKYDGDIVKAAQDAGYPYAVSANKFFPARLIRSQTWQALVRYYFPVYLLFEKNRELLEHQDWRAVNAALERIHKLRGDFVQKVDIRVSTDTDLSTKSDHELNKIIEGEFEHVDAESNASERGINSGPIDSFRGGESGEAEEGSSPI